jgi:hypothetical protein
MPLKFLAIILFTITALNRTGGGGGLYISANLNYKVHKDLTYNNKDCAESLFIEILKPIRFLSVSRIWLK